MPESPVSPVAKVGVGYDVGGRQATDGLGIYRTTDQKSKKPAKMRAKCLCLFGSPTWARTRDLRINSPF